MDQTKLRAAIQGVSERLAEEDVPLVMQYAEPRQLKKGEVLLREGEVCRAFYLVETGYLRTWYNKDGVPINLNFTFEGEYTCNLQSYRSRQPSEYQIEAGEDCLVWVFGLQGIADPGAIAAPFTMFVRRLAIRILLKSEEHSHLFKLYTPTERYHYIEEHNPRLLQRISLSQLASYIGITRETLSRIRARSH